MNREILFRGKRVDNGEWIEGNLLTYPSGDTRIAVTVSGHKNPAIYGSLEFVIPETVGQYTGLTDKNGKKIFEGDIFIGFWKEKLVVYYDNCYLGFRVRTPSGSDNEISYYANYRNNKIDIEIIGNIHDNPELLEVAE